MSSLWTPEGEHRIKREVDGAAEPPSGATEPPTLDASGEEEMRMVARELLAAPVEALVANHCYGLFELAALHLSQSPPNLGAARMAIDAMGLIVEGLGPRLGEHAATLAEGLTQVRLAWVKISDAQAAASPDGQSPDGGEPASSPT